MDRKQKEEALNEVTLLGRVGADPQKRGNETHPLVTFSLATHTNYKDESGTGTTQFLHEYSCVYVSTFFLL